MAGRYGNDRPLPRDNLRFNPAEAAGDWMMESYARKEEYPRNYFTQSVKMPSSLSGKMLINSAFVILAGARIHHEPEA